MLLGEGVVGERLVDGALDQLGGLAEPHGGELGDDLVGLWRAASRSWAWIASRSLWNGTWLKTLQ